MRPICCDTTPCTPVPWFPRKDRAYECVRCERVWTYRVTKGVFADWRHWELTKRPSDIRPTGESEA